MLTRSTDPLSKKRRIHRCLGSAAGSEACNLEVAQNSRRGQLSESLPIRFLVKLHPANCPSQPRHVGVSTTRSEIKNPHTKHTNSSVRWEQGGRFGG
jgi:hypothetical protein